jgi:hypothetical protein
MKTLTYQCNEDQSKVSALMKMLQTKASSVAQAKKAETIIFEFSNGEQWTFQFDANGEAIGGIIKIGE